jgi:4-amino-4-deoxy-L-arabinose transferase-like glycosyltransferase
MKSSIVRQSSVSAYLGIIVIYLVSALLVDPRGEFPLNDDWSYSRSAFRFARENVIEVDEWSAPSLLGQALYGGLLAKIFGPSFTVLRLSTLILSCGLSLILWRTLRALEANRTMSWIVVLAWIFNPIQFSLSFTYMTEIPFAFFVGLGLLAMVRHLETGSIGSLVASGSALGFSALIRQIAALFIAPIFVGLALPQPGKQWRQSLRRAALFAASTIPFLAVYYLWLAHRGGPTPAARRKFELLSQLTTEQVIGNSYGLLFYVCFMLLPLLLYVVPSLRSSWKEAARPFRILSLVGSLLFIGLGLWWFSGYSSPDYFPARPYHGRMPFLLNILYDTGLGPLTLVPTYYSAVPTPVYAAGWILVTIAVAGGLAVLALSCLLGGKRAADSGGRDRTVLFVTGGAFLLIAAFEIVFSHLQEGGLFDRHILAAAYPLGLFLAVLHRRGASAARVTTFLACLLTGGLAYFSVTATHDYLAWNRIRWEMGNELLAQGVDSLNIAGGFEFNAWHNYDTFRARGNVERIFHWWYDEPMYLISMSVEPGYRIVRRAEYASWLHRRPIALYLLKKSG